MKKELNKLKTSGLHWLWIALFLMVADRLSKQWVISHLQFFEPTQLTPFFNLTLAYNTGAAFSFLSGDSGWQNWLFVGLASIISTIIVVWLSRLSKSERWVSIALCLILAGALGNAWDRLRYGFVIDFLDFHIADWHYAIFNIADSGICVGAVMLVFYWIKVRG